MSRLTATIWCDIRHQYRNGFYHAASFVTLLAVGVIWLLPQEFRPFIMANLPLLMIGNLIINTFYFSAGQILLEKREQTLSAQVVTPLLTSEYLASKVLTLTLLSLIENVAIVLLVFGFALNLLPLILGIILAGALFTYAGVAVVARYESVNEYLLPSIGYVSLLGLPLVAWLLNWDNFIIYLHPLQTAMVIGKAAFSSIETWQVAYGLLYGAVWVLYFRARAEKAFSRYIISGEAYS